MPETSRPLAPQRPRAVHIDSVANWQSGCTEPPSSAAEGATAVASHLCDVYAAQRRQRES